MSLRPSEPGRAPRALLVAALVAAVLALAGCGGLPRTGPVIDGRRLGEPINDQVRVGAQGPVDGASPEQVVRGFVRAGEDSDETRQAGKSFLAPTSVDLWNWSGHDVVVYNDDITVRRLSDDAVELRTVAVGRVSPDGRYQEMPAGTVVRATFGLTRVGGEWRILLPAGGFGLWLDSNAFDRLYTNRFVFYVTPGGSTLVPDSRWFPNGPRLATTLARAQLGPVPDYLTGSVVTGVPINTKLAVNAVPIENGIAQVNLSSQALSANPNDRRKMWAQLAATLAQVGTVGSVSLAADGTSLDLQDGVVTVGSPEQLGFKTAPAPQFDTALLRDGEKFTRIDPRFVADDALARRRADTKPLDGDPTSIPQGFWTRLTLSRDGREVAAVGGDLKDLSRWRATQPVVSVPRFASSLTRPCYDAYGYLWVAGEDATGVFRLWAIDTTVTGAAALPRAMSAPWLAGRRVTSIAVSADGARVLVATTDARGDDERVGLSGIVRDGGGTPSAVTTPWRQADPLTLVKDVAWVDNTTYAVLGRIDAAQPVRPWLGTVGAGLEGVRRRGNGQPADSRLAPVARGISITTVGGPRGLVVITDEGRVLVRAGATWRQIDTGTDLLVPGR